MLATLAGLLRAEELATLDSVEMGIPCRGLAAVSPRRPRSWTGMPRTVHGSTIENSRPSEMIS
jgi:hypothetical protein